MRRKIVDREWEEKRKGILKEKTGKKIKEKRKKLE